MRVKAVDILQSSLVEYICPAGSSHPGSHNEIRDSLSSQPVTSWEMTLYG